MASRYSGRALAAASCLQGALPRAPCLQPVDSQPAAQGPGCLMFLLSSVLELCPQRGRGGLNSEGDVIA